jgi:hypothetical protein
MDMRMPKAGTRSPFELKGTSGTMDQAENGLMSATRPCVAPVPDHTTDSAFKVLHTLRQVWPVFHGESQENRHQPGLLGHNVTDLGSVGHDGLGGPTKGAHSAEKMFFAGATADHAIFADGVKMAEDEPGRTGLQQLRLLEKKRFMVYNVISDCHRVLFCTRVLPQAFLVPLFCIRARQDFRMQFRGFSLPSHQHLPEQKKEQLSRADLARFCPRKYLVSFMCALYFLL